MATTAPWGCERGLPSAGVGFLTWPIWSTSSRRRLKRSRLWSTISAASATRRCSRHCYRRRSPTRSSRRFIRSSTGTARPVVPWSRFSCDVGASPRCSSRRSASCSPESATATSAGSRSFARIASPSGRASSRQRRRRRHGWPAATGSVSPSCRNTGAELRRVSNPRSDAAAWTILDVLPAHPVITVPVAVAATARTRPAVANGIAGLEAAGALVPLTKSRRNRAWEASGLLDLIVGIESGEG